MMPLRLAFAGFLLGATPALASTPASWAALGRASAQACIAASGLHGATVGAPLRFSDTLGVEARLISGTYRPAHMKGAAGQMLCLYDRRSRRAEIQDATGMLRAASAGAAPAPVDAQAVKDLMWRATEIDGRPPVRSAEFSMMLDSGGRVGGKSGCNNYSARYMLDGARLTVYPPMKGTRMACRPAAMAQEQAFQAILSGAESLNRRPNDLIVTAADGRAIRLVRQ
jgi:heat shock protein HslJ